MFVTSSAVRSPGDQQPSDVYFQLTGAGLVEYRTVPTAASQAEGEHPALPHEPVDLVSDTDGSRETKEVEVFVSRLIAAVDASGIASAPVSQT